jgi:hypothetical protein
MSYISNAYAVLADGSGGGYPYPAVPTDYTSAPEYDTDLVPISVGNADYVFRISYEETINYSFWLSDAGELTPVSSEDPVIPALLAAAQAHTTARKPYVAHAAPTSFDPTRAPRHMPAVPVAQTAISPLGYVRSFGDAVLESLPLPSEAQTYTEEGASVPVIGAAAETNVPRLYDPFVIGGPANLVDLPSANVARPQQTDIGRTSQKPGVNASWLAT